MEASNQPRGVCDLCALGMVYCMEFLEKNIDWLKEKLTELKGHYFLFDLPGTLLSLWVQMICVCSVQAKLSCTHITTVCGVLLKC